MAGLDNYVKRWSTALHVTVAALIVASSGLVITPVAHAAAAAARLSVSSTWQTGFIAHFTIVNASTVPMTDWRLEFDLPAGESISHTWSSNFAQHGTHYVLTPANWNRIIAPGGSATGGFRGVGSHFSLHMLDARNCGYPGRLTVDALPFVSRTASFPTTRSEWGRNVRSVLPLF